MAFNMVTVSSSDLWEKEGPAWQAILSAAKIETMQVLSTARIAVKEWREHRWDVPDFIASWEVVADKTEANIHVWVEGRQPNYTVFVEGNKWKDTPEYCQFTSFGSDKVAINFRFVPDSPALPDLKELAEQLANVVQQAQKVPLGDGQRYPLVF
jgi:hypothetical protein